MARLLTCSGVLMKLSKQITYYLSLFKFSILLLFITSCLTAQPLLYQATNNYNSNLSRLLHAEDLHIEQHTTDTPQRQLLAEQPYCCTENQNESDSDEYQDFETSITKDILSFIEINTAYIRTKEHLFITLAQGQPKLLLFVLFHSWKSFIC